MMIIAVVETSFANAGVHPVERRVHLRLGSSPADGTLSPTVAPVRCEMLGWHFPTAASPPDTIYRGRSASFGAKDGSLTSGSKSKNGELMVSEERVMQQDERRESVKVGRKRKTSLSSIVMMGERDVGRLGEGSKERRRLLFPRERRNTIESEGERFRKSSFGSPSLLRFKNFSLSSLMGEKKVKMGEEEGEEKRKGKSSYRSYTRRGSVDCVARRRQRKTSLNSLVGLFARERAENIEQLSSHDSLPIYGRSSTRSVLDPADGGWLCSGGKSVREQRLWFSVQWPGLSVSLPEDWPLRRALSDKGEPGIRR